MNPRWGLLMLVVTAGLSLGAGSCTRQPASGSADSTTTTPLPAPTSGPYGTGSGGTASGPVTDTTEASFDTSGAVGGTRDELRARLQAEARRLGEASRAGRLDEVSARALRTRDLVVALAGKTDGLAAAQTRGIDSLVTSVTQTAEKLRAHAAAREMDGVRAQTAELQGVVKRILDLSAR